MVKERNSNIELMKLIALFMVVLCHSLPLYKYLGSVELNGYINLGTATNETNTFLLIIFSHLGQIGNALFIVSSSFFLFDSDNVKSEKVYQYISDVFLVSIFYLMCFFLYYHKIPVKYIINSLAPTTFLYYWFITCYIMLYAIHPFLNSIIKRINQREHLTICLWMLFLYSIVSFLLGGKYFYNNFIGFIMYYFIVSYCKRFLHDFFSDIILNYIILSVSLAFFIVLIFTANVIGLKYAFFSNFIGRIETFVNPFIILISISTFNIFLHKKIKNELLNKIASTSLLVFVISNNELVCAFIKPKVFEKLSELGLYHSIVLICFILAIFSFVFSIIFSLVYIKYFRARTLRIALYIKRIINSFINKIYLSHSDSDSDNNNNNNILF